MDVTGVGYWLYDLACALAVARGGNGVKTDPMALVVFTAALGVIAERGDAVWTWVGNP